jgi:hypothetical protein
LEASSARGLVLAGSVVEDHRVHDAKGDDTAEDMSDAIKVTHGGLFQRVFVK